MDYGVIWMCWNEANGPVANPSLPGSAIIEWERVLYLAENREAGCRLHGLVIPTKTPFGGRPGNASELTACFTVAPQRLLRAQH